MRRNVTDYLQHHSYKVPQNLQVSTPSKEIRCVESPFWFFSYKSPAVHFRKKFFTQKTFSIKLSTTFIFWFFFPYICHRNRDRVLFSWWFSVLFWKKKKNFEWGRGSNEFRHCIKKTGPLCRSGEKWNPANKIKNKNKTNCSFLYLHHSTLPLR